MKRRTISAAIVLILTAVAPRAHAASGIAYTVTDLGTLGGERSFASDINASGQVSGFAQYGPAFLFHAFVYDGVIHDLGTLGGNDSDASGINDAGQIVGSSRLAGNVRTHAFLYDGTLHDLGTFGGVFSEAYGINSAGHVVGWASTAGEIRRAFLYDGTMHNLGTLGGTRSMALAINDSGLITGWSNTAGNATTHPFLYDGTMHDLGVLGDDSGYSFGEASDINAAGHVVGYASTDSGDVHAFLYDGTMHDLGTLGSTGSLGLAINSRDEVVGQSSKVSGPPHAFLYTRGGGMVDLNDLINPLSGWVLGAGRAINDAGQIVGEGTINGQTHGFLLTPVPEPGSFLIAAVGLLGLVVLCIERRRVLSRSGF